MVSKPSLGRLNRSTGSAITFFPIGHGRIQSALDSAGIEAANIADLFWWMVAGASLVWLGVMVLTWHSARAHPESFNRRREAFIVVGCGAILPTIVLAILLVFGLSALPKLVAPAPPESLKVVVSGEMWWWRVRYQPSNGEAVVTANEIHLPVGEPVQFLLESDNVIHSFWIPSLAGKMDMIPGRTTRLALTPTRTGVFRGVCAEYCGTSHALMKFDVVVEEKDQFNRWLAHQATPAAPPDNPLAQRGEKQFLANGCGACHTVRGANAAGVVGPDLTHVGSRLSIAAASWPNEPDHLRRWLADTDKIKPGAYMPKFDMLPSDDVNAMADYLKGLK